MSENFFSLLAGFWVTVTRRIYTTKDPSSYKSLVFPMQLFNYVLKDLDFTR